MNIELKVLNKAFYERHLLPRYATAGSAAIDLYATENIYIDPGETVMIDTGIAIWIGSDINKNNNFMGGTSVVGMILPRSSLGCKGLILANTIGVIDEDYQGELKIAALNRRKDDADWGYGEKNCIFLSAGERIAQLMFVPVIKTAWTVVEEFSSSTQRCDGGWGSSGK